MLKENISLLEIFKFYLIFNFFFNLVQIYNKDYLQKLQIEFLVITQQMKEEYYTIML